MKRLSRESVVKGRQLSPLTPPPAGMTQPTVVADRAFGRVSRPTTVMFPSAPDRPKRKPVFKTLISILTNDQGQGLVEYALIIALVAIIAMAALRSLGGGASNSLTNASNSLS